MAEALQQSSCGSSKKAPARPKWLFLCKWPAPGHQISLVAAENEDAAAQLIRRQREARSLQVGRLASNVQIEEFNERFVLEFVPRVPEPRLQPPDGEDAIECLQDCELLQPTNAVVATEAMGLTLQSSSVHARYGHFGLNVQRAATRAFDDHDYFGRDPQYNIAAALRGIVDADVGDGQGGPGNRPPAMLDAVQHLYEVATKLASQEPELAIDAGDDDDDDDDGDGGADGDDDDDGSDSKGPSSSAGTTAACRRLRTEKAPPPATVQQGAGAGGASSSRVTRATSSNPKSPASGSKAATPGGVRGLISCLADSAWQASGGSAKLEPEAPRASSTSPAAGPKDLTVKAAETADTKGRAGRQASRNVAAGRAASAELVAAAAAITISDSDEEPATTSRAKSTSRT